MNIEQSTQEHWLHRRIIDGKTLLISSEEPLRVLSSSLHGGGIGDKRHLLNLQVPHGYASDDPWQDAVRRMEELNLPPEETTAMMTAADVERVAECSRIGDQFRLRVFVTAGVGNAARAGVERKTYPGYTAGTINIIVAVDGRLTDAALVNAVITVTEAKTAALQELGVTDALGNGATGTTTDTVVVAATQSDRWTGVHQYAGVATELGNGMAHAVYCALLASLEYLRTGDERDGS